jgi:hypothetical protein
MRDTLIFEIRAIQNGLTYDFFFSYAEQQKWSHTYVAHHSTILGENTHTHTHTHTHPKNPRRPEFKRNHKVESNVTQQPQKEIVVVVVLRVDTFRKANSERVVSLR